MKGYRWLLVLTSVIILGAGIFCFTGSPNLTDEEVYSIINQLIEDDSIAVTKACCQFNRLSFTGDYVKELTTADFLFNLRQRILFRNSVIKGNSLRWLKNGSGTASFIPVEHDCSRGILYHISFPLVSIDRKKVIIEFTEDCNCSLGGQGAKYLYEKRSGHWKRIGKYEAWIS